MSFYITTPIYYVNAEPHIGHVYSTLIADVFARWARLNSVDTLFLTGTDEHGQKIQEAADKANIGVKDFVDIMSNNFRQTFKKLGFTPNNFIRTTDQHHIERVRQLWKKLQDSGLIYMGKYSGWYNISDETFVQQSGIEDRDGLKFCNQTGKELVWHEEDNYMFRLSQFKDRLLQHYDANPNWIIPESRQIEVRKFVEAGLEDISVSRKKTTCNWGIETDNDQVIYVWLDALTNYLSGTDMHNALDARDTRDTRDTRDACDTSERIDCKKTKNELFEFKYWPGIHVIGKDILKFHAVYWPAFLMGADIQLPLHIVTHGWWTKDGKKISKSTGNVFDPIKKAEEYGMDQMRYYLLRETPFSSDGDFSDGRMEERVNGELANVLGNLVSRVMTLSSDAVVGMSECDERDTKIIHDCAELKDKIQENMTKFDIRASLEEIWVIIGALNKYVNETKPWILKKSDYKKFSTVMYILLESIRYISTLLIPFLPNTSKQILSAFGLRSNIIGLSWGLLSQNKSYNFKKLILFPKKQMDE